MVKLSDVFFIPGISKVNPWDIIFKIVLFTTVVPGILLFICSFGVFRYFHLMDMFSSYTVTRELRG